MTWVTFHHLVGGLEAGVGDLSNGQLLVVGLEWEEEEVSLLEWLMVDALVYFVSMEFYVILQQQQPFSVTISDVYCI